MNIWVTGATGQVGHLLLETLKKRGVRCFGTTREEVDIADPSKIESMAAQATHIINCAGFARVDPAEIERTQAHLANAVGPGLLAKAAKKAKARFLHLSTDYVFDGKQKRPYTEEDRMNPLNWYGETKREGEIRVFEANPDACVIRISWVFGGFGPRHYVSQALQLFHQKKELFFADDQIGKPTYAPDLVHALIVLLDQTGLYHYSNAGSLSKYAFTRAIWEWAKQRELPMLCEQIIPICSAEFKAAAKRPLYTPLDTSKIEKLLPIRPWREALAEYMCQIS